MYLLAFFTFLQRILSGYNNKLGYNRTLTYRRDTTSVYCIEIILLIVSAFFGRHWWQFLFVGLSYLAIYLDYKVFDAKQKPWNDIHLWETANTAMFTICMIVLGADIITISLLLYTTLFAHKAVINKAYDQNWWWSATDDPTGQTFGIPFLGIKIPRLNQKRRFWIAIFGLIVFFVNIFTIKFAVTIYDIYSHIVAIF